MDKTSWTHRKYVSELYRLRPAKADQQSDFRTGWTGRDKVDMGAGAFAPPP